MLATLWPPRFTIGRTLGDSLKIFGRNFIVFALVALAIRLLFWPCRQGQAAGAIIGAGQINWFSAIVSMAVAIVVASVTKAVMVFPTMQNLRGQKALVSDLWKGVPVFPAIIMAGAILSLPSFVSLAIQGLFPGDAAVIGISGFVVGVVALVLILIIGGSPLLAGFGLTDLASLASIQSTSPIGIAVFIFSALIGAFEGVLTTVSYYHLRVEKEGAIAEDLIQVFD